MEIFQAKDRRKISMSLRFVVLFFVFFEWYCFGLLIFFSTVYVWFLIIHAIGHVPFKPLQCFWHITAPLYNSLTSVCFMMLMFWVFVTPLLYWLHGHFLEFTDRRRPQVPICVLFQTRVGAFRC